MQERRLAEFRREGFDAQRFFATRAAINDDGVAVGKKLLQEGKLKIVVNSLTGIFARAQTDGNLGNTRLHHRGDIGFVVLHVKHFAQPFGCELGQGSVHCATESPAFEEEVAGIVANRNQAELRKAGIGIDDNGTQFVNGDAQLGSRQEPFAQYAATAVVNGNGKDTRVGSEHLGVFGGANQADLGIGKAFFGGSQSNAGNGDIGAKRNARENKDAADFAPQKAADLAHAAVAAHQLIRIVFGQSAADYVRKQARINVAQSGFKQIAKLLNDKAKKRARGIDGEKLIVFVESTSDQIVERARGPSAIL
jgi:hypothetical protein